jgi:hypothetical protein
MLIDQIDIRKRQDWGCVHYKQRSQICELTLRLFALRLAGVTNNSMTIVASVRPSL